MACDKINARYFIHYHSVGGTLEIFVSFLDVNCCQFSNGKKVKKICEENNRKDVHFGKAVFVLKSGYFMDIIV